MYLYAHECEFAFILWAIFMQIYVNREPRQSFTTISDEYLIKTIPQYECSLIVLCHKTNKL